MFWIIHALVGMILGLTLNSLVLIVVLSFVSHFFIDLIPHWDSYFDNHLFEKTGKIKIKKRDLIIRLIDISLTVSFVLFLYFRFNNILLILGSFSSVLPDMIKGGYITKLKSNKIYFNYLKFHSKIQGKASMIVGLVIQIIFFLMLNFILLRLLTV